MDDYLEELLAEMSAAPAAQSSDNKTQETVSGGADGPTRESFRSLPSARCPKKNGKVLTKPLDPVPHHRPLSEAPDDDAKQTELAAKIPPTSSPKSKNDVTPVMGGEQSRVTIIGRSEPITVLETGDGKMDGYTHAIEIKVLPLTMPEANQFLANAHPFDGSLKLRKKVISISEGKVYILLVFGSAGTSGRNAIETSGINFIKECRKYSTGRARNGSTKTYILGVTLDRSKVVSIDEKDPMAIALIDE